MVALPSEQSTSVVASSNLDVTELIDDIKNQPGALPSDDEPEDHEETKFYYEDIVGHEEIAKNRFEFRVRWNTGEITMEPDKYLREDVTKDFAVYLRRTGLSERKQYKWANEIEIKSDGQNVRFRSGRSTSGSRSIFEFL